MEFPREARLRLFVVPTALVIAWLLSGDPTGRFLGRAFLSMWVHEAGHAIAAWFCGIWAIPGPWFTPVEDGRSFPVAILLTGALGYGFLRARARGSRLGQGAALLLLVLQVIGTLFLSLRAARLVITFAGDGGGLILGTLLMTSFAVGPANALRTRGLRWGFAAIGAFAFVDTTRTWWEGRRNLEAIPFGRIEGTGLSDPSRLLETYGWSPRTQVGAYLALAGACLLVLAWVQVRSVLRARREEDDDERVGPRGA